MSKEAFTVLAEMGTPLCMTRNTVKVKTKNAKDVYTSGFQSSCKDFGDNFVFNPPPLYVIRRSQKVALLSWST